MNNQISQYSFVELRDKALAFQATPQDRLNLLWWFEHYGDARDWNGEYWKIEAHISLYPIYKPIGDADKDGEYDQWEIIDAKIQ